MEQRELEEGDVVQIIKPKDTVFHEMLMIVTDPAPWGAMGYVPTWDIAPQRDPPVKIAQAYYRAGWHEMEYVGKAKLWRN
jgi:hypothetical protein